MAVRSPSLESAQWINHVPLCKTDLEGGLVLLDFFTYCCVNCLNILPDLKALEKEFKKELLVIGIHSAKHSHEKETSNIKEALKKYKIDHIVINDGDLNLWEAFGIKAWPSLVLLDSKGYIISSYQGEGHLQALREDIKQEIQKTKPSSKSFKPDTQEIKGLLKFPQKILASQDYLFISHLDEVLVCTYEGLVLHKISNLKEPQGMAYVNGSLFIALREGNCIIEISENFLKKTIFLENLRNPYDLDSDGITLFVALAGAHQIKAYDLTTKQEVLAIGQENSESLHDGPFSEAVLAQPTGLSLLEDELYFVDSEISSLRCASFNEVNSLIYNNDELQHPLDLTVGQYGDGCGGGRVFITDSYNNKLKVYNPQTKEVVTILDDLNEPSGVDKKACELYICNTNKHEIIIFDLSQMQKRTLELREYL